MLYTDDLRLEKFGNHLRELRINKGVTVRDIYLKTNIDITTLSRLENGLIKFWLNCTHSITHRSDYFCDSCTT